MLCKRLTRRAAGVVSFRAPTTEEIGHDHLWRVHKELPAKGEIAIFNRSHYEDIIGSMLTQFHLRFGLRDTDRLMISNSIYLKIVSK